jgi:hypothetical protein
VTQIKPNQDFKHDRKTYKKGRKYEVEAEDADYFIQAGWVGDGSSTGDQSLDIQDVQLGHSSGVN